MTYSILIAILTGTTVVDAQVRAATVEGGYGLIYMQTARTYGKGAWVLGLQTLTMQRDYSILGPGGSVLKASGYPTFVSIPFAFGLTDEVELTATAWGYHDARALANPSDVRKGYGPPVQGFGSARVGVKIRLPLSMDAPVQFAGGIAATFDTADHELDGMNYRWARRDTDVETSLYQSFDITSFLNVNLQEGYVLSGSHVYDDQIIGALGLQLVMHERLSLNLEIANRTFRGVGPYSALQAGSVPSLFTPLGDAARVGDPAAVKDAKLDYEKDLMLFSPSMVLQLSDGIALTLGANVNLADQLSPRETLQGVFGISFNGTIDAMIDSDGDGINNHRDREPSTVPNFPVDRWGVALDGDADGVPDGADHQMTTPRGALVDANGVGYDTDGDGVYDGLDLEPDTPWGAPVDARGMGLDGDGDGVPDHRDREKNTPVGVLVDLTGVGLDTDDDGVYDGLDRENNTPAGAFVDEFGVGLDGDKDGVPDGVDKDPKTPSGILVDPEGRALTTREYTLLRDGMLTLNAISFQPGTAILDSTSYVSLDEIGEILEAYPTLRMQIGGHTDSSGDREINYRLSRERAVAVRSYLIRRFPSITIDRLQAIGFGSDKPIASNESPDGRQQNRRVEFVIINQDELLNLNRTP